MNEPLWTVGKCVPRIDALEKVTGSAKYAPDLKLEGMLYAGLLRSPHAHARVKRIDTARAEKLAGVRAIATILEVPKVIEYWFFLRTEEKKKRMFLLDNIVRFVGDPVLAVAGEDEEVVAEALDLIQVDYEILPAIFSPAEALQARDIKIHTRGNIAFQVQKNFGDAEQGFRDSHLIVENTYHTSKQKHAALEPIGTCLADYQPNGKLTVYCSTQLPHWSRVYLAGALGLAINKVRVIKPHTGGAFGGRCGLIHGLEVMASALSRKAVRPVRLSFSRAEDFIGTETRHPMEIRIKTGVSRDGFLLANEIAIVADVGAYGTHYIGVLADCLSTGVGLYKIPNVRFSGLAVFTNQSLTGAFRGYGNPQMNFAQESQMDILAEKLGLDPLAFRLKNFRRAGETDPVLGEKILSNGLEECLQKGSDAFGWQAKRQRKPVQGAKRSGVGLAIMLHGTGAARALPDPASATVLVNLDGSVNVVTAAADDGQGNRTVLAQVASEVLAIPYEKISVSDTDTDMTPLDCGTHGSRQTYAGGLAVRNAALKARERILELAAKEMGAAVEDLFLKQEAVHDRRRPERVLALQELMRKIQVENMGLCEQIMGSASGVAPAMPGYYGACFAEVEVDVETGEVKVLKLTGAYDVGKAINPDLVKGQIIGGAVMGMGWALTEGLLLQEGRILNGNLRDYRLLRACDVPEMEAIIVESNEPTGPFGAKGIGEGTTVCIASAIANAVYHAVGIRMRDLPITPEKILNAF
jgi:xanthine dehydrogenase molybdenum-binding subunit